MVAPPLEYVSKLKNLLNNKIQVGTQNISRLDSGFYSKQANANWTIVGHSSRRTKGLDTDVDIALQVKTALDNNIKVILCVTESDQDIGSNTFRDESILKKQFDRILHTNLQTRTIKKK